MPLDGSGNYTRTDGTRTGQSVFRNQASQNVTPSAALFDAHANDFVTALETAWFRDGQNTPSADLSMGGRKLTSLGAATAPGDAARFDQINPPAFQALTYQAALTWNVANIQNGTLVLSGNVDSLTLSNEADGRVYILRISQDGTGGRTFAWPAGWYWSGPEPTLSDGANEVDILTLLVIGSNIYAVLSQEWAT